VGKQVECDMLFAAADTLLKNMDAHTDDIAVCRRTHQLYKEVAVPMAKTLVSETPIMISREPFQLFANHTKFLLNCILYERQVAHAKKDNLLALHYLDTQNIHGHDSHEHLLRFGGSHPQREGFEQTLIDIFAVTGQYDRLQSMVDTRISRKRGDNWWGQGSSFAI
jgi:hypothetical protein